MSEFLPNGALIGRYRILAPIGQGGMATVYKVTDTVLERDVALKLIRTEKFPPIVLETVLKRFEREAKALARLNNPNIVKIRDYGDFGNAPFLVMDYLPGQSFKQIRKPIPYKTAIFLIRPIADALAYAHEQGIYHRDVKTGNIMLTQNGTPVLTDFGIAKLLDTDEGNTLTASGVGIGTPEYMAPEQGFGREIDGRADQYSLAIVLYELITAHKPFRGNNPMEVIYKHHNDPVPPMREFAPDVPSSVENVIRRALSKLPAQRFPDMTSFARALEDALLPSNSQLTFTTPLSSGTHVFDTQPRSNRDTVPVMPFNTSPNSKVNSQAQTTTKKKTKLETWIIPLALLVIVGAFYILRHPNDTPVPQLPAIHISTDTLVPKDISILTPVPPTIVPTEIHSLTPEPPTEVETLSEFLVKKQYARMGAYIRNIADPGLRDKMINFVYKELYNDEIGLIPYKTCNEQYGYISIFGENVIKPQFDYAGPFSEGLARVEINSQFGYINALGENVIKPQFYDTGDFSQGLAIAWENGKYGYINRRGEFVIEPQFDNARSFSDGLAPVLSDGNRGYNYINTSGRVVIESQFDWAWSFSEGLALVMKDNRWGYINSLGDFAIEPQFHYDNNILSCPGFFSEGLAAVEKNGQWGYINTKGNFVIEPKADDAGDFSYGLAPVMKNGKWGYINTIGEFALQPQFDNAETFTNGLASVTKNGTDYFIDPTGETVFVACQK